MHASIRKLEDCDPTRPTDSMLSGKNSARGAFAILDGDTYENNIKRTFASLKKLRDLRMVLFGSEDEKNVSLRKEFGLIVRASGAHNVREEGGWAYSGMRNRHELNPGEQSDEEEDGPEDGPSECCIM